MAETVKVPRKNATLNRTSGYPWVHLEGLLPKPKRSCGQPCPQNDTRRKLSKFEEARTADMAVRPSRAFGQQALNTVLER
jgi:hypothetical protein